MNIETNPAKRWRLAAAIAATLGAGSLPAGPVGTFEGYAFGPNDHVVLDAASPSRYIVRFAEPALASYHGGIAGYVAAPRRKTAHGRNRIDIGSAQAQAYVAMLAAKQNERVGAIASAIGRSAQPVHAMQHALNALVLDLAPAEAQRIATLDGVVAIEQDVMHQLASDIGPGFIGASSLWWGVPAGEDTIFVSDLEDTQRLLGDGVVIGDIDTGYNSLSPSFAVTDDKGYTITNPLGHGQYLGQCSVKGISLAGCNDKVIGAYDFINGASVEDAQGHGSHTGSTSGGNSRAATLGAYTAHISGVAPHANLVIYRACAADGCPGSALDSAINQAVADGVVDVINYSISGGSSPWNDSNSLAFAAAADAGIFVAAAAGNTNASVPTPVPGSVNHQEPWTTTVAASTHTGGPVTFPLTVSGAGAPAIGLEAAVSGTKLSAPFAATTLQVSPTYGTAGDGCSSFPGGTFAGKIALLKFDGNPPCNTDARAGHALAAGAVAVVIGSGDSQFITSGANQQIPVFTMPGTQSDLLAVYVNSNPGVTGSIGFPATARAPMTPDSLGNFSLLGPSFANVIKPDVQAPGVSILAAVANDMSANGPNNVALYDGTSMATPHTAGTGALLVQMHPDWTPMEIKSALMMTAKEAGLTRPDGITPSSFYDRGAGRIQANVAAQAGLVLDEVQVNFIAADPAKGGDPATLNLASMDQMRCIDAASGLAECAFTRTLRSTRDHTVNWTTALTGAAIGSVSPANFQMNANDMLGITVTIDASSFASDGASHFGELVLTPDDGSPVLHMPIAVAVPPPAIASASAVTVSIPAGATTQSANLPVGNSGGPTLNVDTNYVAAGNVTYVILNQTTQGSSGYGYYSSYETDAGAGAYTADDFQVSGTNVDLARIVAYGFSTATPLAWLSGFPVHFRIYHDAGGKPDGAPDGNPPVNNPPVWSFDATIDGTPGLDVTGDTITMDLAAAGVHTNLAAGHYWLLVYPEMYSVDFGWAWYVSPTNLGSPATVFVSGRNQDWIVYPSQPGLAVRIEQKITCGAPWLSATPPSLTLGVGVTANVGVSADSTQFGGDSSAIGYLCLHSNDPASPVSVVRVNAMRN